jgi:hypothetical protein
LGGGSGGCFPYEKKECEKKLERGGAGDVTQKKIITAANRKFPIKMADKTKKETMK